MQDIIAINKTTINGVEENSVNSREIYEYLEVNTAYSMWIQRAIEKYDFISNEDYIEITTDTKSGKRDYIVTLDMAKELCMVSNTEKGKETRKYFIAIEKESRKIMTPAENLVYQAQRLLEHERELEDIKCAQELLATEQERLQDNQKALLTSVVDVATELDEKVNVISQRVEDTNGIEDYYAIVGYASKIHLAMPRELAMKLGRNCSSYCKRHGIRIGKVKDAMYGVINTYPEKVCERVFNIHFRYEQS